MGGPGRKIVSLKATVSAGAVNCSAVIESLSGNSIYLRAVPHKPLEGFRPGEVVEVKFEPLEGESVSVSGKIKWSYRTPPYGLTDSVGIEVQGGGTAYSRLIRVV